MKVLSVDQAGLFAWSNSKKNKSLFATASIYDSFSNADSTQEEGILQLYSLDIVHKTSSSKKLGIAKIEGVQFTSLNWHAFGEEGLYPYGVIASGFNEGSVGLWDVNTILQNTAGNAEDINGRGLICLQNVHSAPVRALSFNPIRRHLLASGGSEVAIHNIEKDIADPEVFSPGDNLHEGSFVTSVSWNRTVPHILGSASQNGVSVVWDLKINKPIFNFSDNNRGLNRNVSLSWSPEIPTQFAVAYDDEKTPEFQIWDLRNPKGPIYCSMKGHTKGIHSLDWCLTDPSLIVTLGRDNKTCIWNYKVSDSNPIVSESALNEPCTSVQWSPMQPEIYALTSAAGSSTVYSLNDQIDHIPIWLRPPVGARFSFDGRLAVFSQKGEGRVREYDVNPEEDQLLPYILDFEQNFLTSQVDINSLCDSRIFSKLLTEEEKEEWKFIKASISNNPDDIIKVIGLDKEKVIKKAEDYTNKTYTKDVASNTHRTNDFNFRVPSQKEADDFFNFLAEQGNKAGSSQHQQVNDEDADGEVTVTETITKNTNWNAGIEKLIKDNILIGNIEGAVDSALKCGRAAEAFLLAYSKGEDFFRSTVESYVTSCNDSFVKNVVRYLVEDEITELVQKYPLEDWKECVALCVSLTNGANHTFRQHMDELALRFSKASEHSSALLCYILSKNFLRILETFAFRTESFEKGSDEHTIFLLRTIEKLIALRIITNNLDSNPIVDRFIYELTKPLHIYKRDTLILNLFTINNSSGFECLILKDRILSSLQEHSKGHRQQFPFRQETVNSKHKPQIDHSRKSGIGHNPQAQSQQMSRPTQAHPQPHAQGQSQFPPAGQPKPVGFQPGFKPSAEPAHGLGNAPIKGHQHDVPPISNVQPKNFPPPTGGMGMPKPTGAPFNQAPGFSPSVQSSAKDLSHPPPTSFTSSTQAPFGTAGKGPLNTSAQDLSMSSTTGPLTDSSRLGPKATPFSGAQSIQTSQSFQQESIPDQSPTMGRPQQQRPGPPVKAQPPGFKGAAMPKGVGGPVRASQPGLPSTQPGQPISGPIGSNPGPMSGPTGAPLGGPTGHPQSGPPTGLMGGPPVRPGPGNNPPKQPVPVTSPVQHVQQQVSQSTTLQSGGQIGGPPLGGQSLGGPTRGPVPGGMGGPPKTQGFKPGMPVVPGKGPVQMPPRMPGAGPGPNMGGQVPK